MYEANFSVHGVLKVWRQLRCVGRDIVRYTVARLRRAIRLQGVIRATKPKTTLSNEADPCPLIAATANSTPLPEEWCPME